MKKLALILALVAMSSAGVANAAVTSITASFKGGCVKTNTGTCTIKATAKGSSLASAKLQIFYSATENGTYSAISSRSFSPNSSGIATKRFANKAGCYYVGTARNGNSAKDIRSKKICE